MTRINELKGLKLNLKYLQSCLDGDINNASWMKLVNQIAELSKEIEEKELAYFGE